MKKYILLFTLVISYSLQAQSVEGRLTLNGKSKTSLASESNSAVQLFKEFKTGKYQLQFSFDGKDLVKNLEKETIVFFNFRTVIKKDGKLDLQQKSGQSVKSHASGLCNILCFCLEFGLKNGIKNMKSS